MILAENQIVREWAHTKLVGARVDFSAGYMHGLLHQNIRHKYHHKSEQDKICPSSIPA